MQNKILLFILIICYNSFCYTQNSTVSLHIISSEDQKNINHAKITLSSSYLQENLLQETNNYGLAKFYNLKHTVYKVMVSHPDYISLSKTFNVDGNKTTTISLKPKIATIEEVVITAKESKGLTSTSIIDQRAMQHLQPSSFTDLLELLPGGKSKDPIFNTTNQIRLREVGTADENYDTSSLGTSFLIDGIPINTNTNMQYVTGSEMLIGNHPQGYAAKRRNTLRKGVDMRTISTDQIEKVEIIRGIPSVEHGDLTSGLVKIVRKKGTTGYEARFKADGLSKLYALGKGFEFNKGWTLNVGIDYLNATSDPRNVFENYKRLTTSARIGKEWAFEKNLVTWNTSLDFSQSVDDERVDPDNDYTKVDRYQSTNQNLAFANRLGWNFLKSKFLKTISFDQSVTQSFERIEQTKFIQVNGPTAVPNTLQEGVSDGLFLSPQYISHLLVDGKPIDLYTKLTAHFDWGFDTIINDLKIGSEWSYSKNNGLGQVYNPLMPPSPEMQTRQRSYKELPSYQDLSFFIENMSEIPLKNHHLHFSAGIRGTSLLNLSPDYAMYGKYYLDPRFNLQWVLPKTTLFGKEFNTHITVGYGIQTKFPILSMLYPEMLYTDFVQLNYFHDQPSYRRINLMTYVTDATHYTIQPAINHKHEVRADITYDKNRLSITYFNEDMNTGFRNTSLYSIMNYRKYDASGLDHNGMASPPDISTLPYIDVSRLQTYGITSNGSQTWKRGIEFQFMSKRFQALKTRLTINGSWFKTIYRNSIPLYKGPSKTIYDENGIEYKYLGLYLNNDGYNMERFNTNFTVDTYLPKLNMEISASLQFLWFAMKQKMRMGGTPTEYVDTKGQQHPYTENDKTDYLLQWLDYKYNDVLFRKETTPMSMSANIKVSKIIYKNYRVAMFVNRLFEYYKEYKINGSSVNRRGLTDPYFGMEINFNF